MNQVLKNKSFKQFKQQAHRCKEIWAQEEKRPFPASSRCLASFRMCLSVSLNMQVLFGRAATSVGRAAVPGAGQRELALYI